VTVLGLARSTDLPKLPARARAESADVRWVRVDEVPTLTLEPGLALAWPTLATVLLDRAALPSASAAALDGVPLLHPARGPPGRARDVLPRAAETGGPGRRRGGPRLAPRRRGRRVAHPRGRPGAPAGGRGPAAGRCRAARPVGPDVPDPDVGAPAAGQRRYRGRPLLADPRRRVRRGPADRRGHGRVGGRGGRCVGDGGAARRRARTGREPTGPGGTRVARPDRRPLRRDGFLAAPPPG